MHSTPSDAQAQAARLRARFRAEGLQTSKRFGQHFLADLNLARKLVQRLGDPAGGPFLEIGPGLGALTFVLVDAGFTGVAIEVDRRLASWLGEALAPWPGVEVIEGDFLEIDADLLRRFERPPQVIGNLPYYATSAILLKLIAWRADLDDAVLTMQREVALRLAASPGSRTYGSLSVALQLHATIETVATLPRQAFWPAPDVDSTAIHVRWNRRPLDPEAAALVERVTRAGFHQRRKQLSKALASELDLDRPCVHEALAHAGVDGAARAEDVAPDQFALIALRLRDLGVLLGSRDRPPSRAQEKQ